MGVPWGALTYMPNATTVSFLLHLPRATTVTSGFTHNCVLPKYVFLQTAVVFWVSLPQSVNGTRKTRGREQNREGQRARITDITEAAFEEERERQPEEPKAQGQSRPSDTAVQIKKNWNLL